MLEQASNERLAKLSWRERIGYGLGDAGFNFYWAIIGSYLIFFYTDIFGISAAAAATMVTVTKIVDAFTDPAMGAIADKTRSRWGKFRPYLLFGTLPMMGAGLLTMTTPDLGDSGKLIWAYATYMILMLTYTVLNMPYNSLSGVLTADAQERNTLNSTRFFFAYFTGIIVGAATPDLAEYFGGGDRYSPIGWQITMSIYAVVASILFVITFATTKERIAPPAEQESKPWQDLKSLLVCRPWIIIFILAMVIMTTFTLRGSSATYYFKYFVERPDLLGSFVGLQVLGLMIGAMSASTLTRYIDKVKLLMILMGIVSLLCFAFAFVPKPQALGVVEVNEVQESTLEASTLLGSGHTETDQYRWTRYEKVFWIIKDRVDIEGATGESLNIESLKNETISVVRTKADGTVEDSSDLPTEILLMFVLSMLISLALGPKAPITWAMYADVADYNEWKTGRRATGMTFSATTFSQKLGSAAGSAIMLSVLAMLGYEANQVQNNASLEGIVYMQTLAPGIFAFIAIIALYFYDLTGDKLTQIQQELAAR